MKAIEFPLLNSLKDVDHLLTSEEVLESVVDEDRMFRDLVKAGIINPSGPLILAPMRDPIPTSQVPAPQAPQESEFSSLQDLPNTKI